MPTQDDAQDERREAYDFRRFILRAAIAYNLAFTPPVASIFKYSRSLDDRDNGAADWELEMSRQAQLRRGIDLKRIINRFLEDLSRDHGTKRSEQFIDWVLNGQVSRIQHAKRGQIYADRSQLIDAIKDGGYRRGDFA